MLRRCPTCTARPAGRNSAGGGSLAWRPCPRRSRRGRWSSSSSRHTAHWCRDRTGRPGCTPLEHAPGNAAEPGGTYAGCSGCFQESALCRPGRTLSAEHRTSRTGHSPVPPSGTGSPRSAAGRRKLKDVELVNSKKKKGQGATGVSFKFCLIDSQL